LPVPNELRIGIQLANNIIKGSNKELVVMRALSILLVEDSPSDVRLIREALKETPLDVDITVARDGEEAMEHLRRVEQGLQFRPDLVLLDLNLPKKNGREVLAEVKSSPTLKQIPVLVMTSSRADEDVMQAYTLNANCYITKPIDLNEYLAVVQAIEDFWFMTATLPDTLHPSPTAAGLNGHTLSGVCARTP
jgi:chemotaxis family two-component system response regulator Rcp1